MDLDSIISIKTKGVGQIKNDHPQEQLEQQIAEVYALQKKLSVALDSLYYAKGVHKYSFGIGDIVECQGTHYEVVNHDMGMFWGKKVLEKKLKYYALYSAENYTIIKSKR
jgi:hypothetical protein